MKPSIIDISSTLKEVKWIRNDFGQWQTIGFPNEIPSEWPMSHELNILLSQDDEYNRSIGNHIKGVVASINAFTSLDFHGG